MMRRTVPFFVLGAVALVLWVGVPRGETLPPSNARVYFSPSGEDRVIHKALDELLSTARKSVDVAMFQFTSPELGKLLLKVRKDARVRILLDKEQTQGKYSQDRYLTDKDGLELRYVVLPGRGADSAKFHHKFCVVDGETVATGSYNWTVLADEENFENLLILHDREVAQQYTAQFEKIWNDDKLTTKK